MGRNAKRQQNERVKRSKRIKRRNQLQLPSLNVFTYGYIPVSVCFFDNIKQFFRNIKYAWQRATRGYCEWDIWRLSSYYTELMRDSLHYFAETTHGYPNCFESGDAWSDYVDRISELFDHSIDREFEGGPKYYHNIFQEEYLKRCEEDILSEPSELQDSPDLSNVSTLELLKMSLEEDRRINMYRRMDRTRAFKMLLKHFEDLYD